METGHDQSPSRSSSLMDREELLDQVERIMAHNIPDRQDRRLVAMTVVAHIRSVHLRALRKLLEPYLAAGSPPLPPDEATAILRDVISTIAGHSGKGCSN